jgi:hypothetical protein
MQPDACSQQRSGEVLEAVRFPILTFDEWQPGRPPGRGFKNDWLLPGESLVSILWKFACANALPGDVLMRLMCPDADPLEGMIPLRSALDLTQLRRLLRLPVNVLRTSLLDRTPSDRYHSAFRYCRRCPAHGYHSVLHQLAEEIAVRPIGKNFGRDVRSAAGRLRSLSTAAFSKRHSAASGVVHISAMGCSRSVHDTGHATARPLGDSGWSASTTGQ